MLSRVMIEAAQAWRRLSRRRSAGLRAGATLILLAAATACFAAGDPVTTEITRLETAAAALDPAKLHEDIRDMVQFTRDRVAMAKDAGDPLLRLYRLRDAHVLTETLTYVAAHPAETKELDRFLVLWNAEKTRLAAPARKRRSDFVRNALIEAAHNRAEKLRAASLPYAKASSPFGGLYYLAEASANLSFARWIDSLPPIDGPSPKRPTLAQLTAAADALEKEALTFFAADQTARTVIPSSAKLKETRELIAAGLIDGATLTLRETRLELTRRQDKAAAEKPLNPLEGLAGFTETIAAGAEARLAAAKAPVTVTLIRWPYT